MFFLGFEETRVGFENEFKELKERCQELDTQHQRKSKELQEIQVKLKNATGLDPKDVFTLKNRTDVLVKELSSHLAMKKDTQYELDSLNDRISQLKDSESKAYATLKRSGKESISELKAITQQLYSVISPLEQLSLYHHTKDDVPFYDVWMKRQVTIRETARDAFGKAYGDVLRILNTLNFFQNNVEGWADFLTHVQTHMINSVVVSICDALEPLYYMSTGRSHVPAFSLQMKLNLSRRVCFHPMEVDVPKIFQQCITDILNIFSGYQHLHTAVNSSTKPPGTFPASWREIIEHRKEVQQRIKVIQDAVSKERDHIAEYVLRFEDEFQCTWMEDISMWDLIKCGMTATKLEFHWNRFQDMRLTLIDCGPIKEALLLPLRSRYDELRLLALASRYNLEDDLDVRAGPQNKESQDALTAYYKFSNKQISNPLVDSQSHISAASATKNVPSSTTNIPTKATPPPAVVATQEKRVESSLPAPSQLQAEQQAKQEAAEALKRAREIEENKRKKEEEEEEQSRRAEMNRLLELERQAKVLAERKAKEDAEAQKIKEAEEALLKRKKERELANQAQRSSQPQSETRPSTVQSQSTTIPANAAPEPTTPSRPVPQPEAPLSPPPPQRMAPPERPVPIVEKVELADRPSTVASSRDTMKGREEIVVSSQVPQSPDPMSSTREIMDRRPSTVAPLLDMYRSHCTECGIKPNSGLLKLLPREPGRYVEEINLDLNYIGIKGIQPLLHILKINRGLRYLNLKDNNLENNEIKALCQVLNGEAGSVLKTLDLSNNPISLGGGNALLELVIQQKSLQQVNLKGTLIQAKVIEKIQDVLKARTT